MRSDKHILILSIILSESAVALLRFRVKWWCFPIKDRDLPAYQQLVDAGIMEPDGSDFRFTEGGWSRREEILREDADRIERERYSSRVREAICGMNFFFDW